MPQPTAKHLRIFREEVPDATRPGADAPPGLPKLAEAFRQATGWSLRYEPGAAEHPGSSTAWSAPVKPGVGTSPGHLKLEPGDSPARMKAESARALGSAIAGMLGELERSRHALWLREAELAAGVPLVPHHDEKQHLAVRLESVLEAAAQNVGCRAAGLYLLDEATTTLKLRSAWGLPQGRLADPPRPLQGALADLEAMLGHAVVLDDTDVLETWNPPERFAAAVCVPVSTPTTILGTAWFFADSRQDFGQRETNLLEIVAGRLAAELEREMLLREGVDGAKLKRQLAEAERLQRTQLPSVPPLLDGWEMAGWTAQSETVGGDFHDWFTLAGGQVAVAVGDVMDRGMAGALAAAGLRASLRSHAQHHRDVDTLLRQVNMTLWTGSAGDQFATLFCGLMDPATGLVRYASAGDPAMAVLRRGSWTSLDAQSPPLGESPEASFGQRELTLQPGEALVVFTAGFRDALDSQRAPLGEAGIAAPLSERLDLPAADLVLAARELLESHTAGTMRDDATVLVLKRTNP